MNELLYSFICSDYNAGLPRQPLFIAQFKCILDKILVKLILISMYIYMNCIKRDVLISKRVFIEAL